MIQHVLPHLLFLLAISLPLANAAASVMAAAAKFKERAPVDGNYAFDLFLPWAGSQASDMLMGLRPDSAVATRKAAH
jgi:hypothetical protein